MDEIEYRVRIDHIVDGEKKGTDYVSIDHDTYIKIMRIIIDS